MVFQNDILAGSSGASGTSTAVHTIDQSIRFNDDDSAQMSRTPSSSSTSQRAFSISMWVKRGNLTTGNRGIISWEGANDNNELRLYFDDDALVWWYYPGSDVAKIITNRLFRDVSAWYNILVVSDTENAVASERWRMYINGQRETSFSSSTFPTQNTDIALFSSTSYPTRIGKARSASPNTFDGYLAEIVVIDGQALDPSSFGEYNSSNIWIPKDVSGLTFGTNGFHIDGRDSADLGDDESGNGNDFTTSGLASDDQKSDSPTSNHTTWNPLTTSAQTYSNGNLNSASSSSSWKGGLTTAQVPLNSGTWYYEIYVDSAGASSGQFSIGWSESNRSVSDDNSSGDTEGWVTYAINGNYYANGGTGSYGATYTTGDVIGCKIDTDSSTNNVEFYKNGASQGTISQAFNTGGTGFISPYILLYATRNATARFAQAEWTQTPSGITTSNAINTTNLGS